MHSHTRFLKALKCTEKYYVCMNNYSLKWMIKNLFQNLNIQLQWLCTNCIPLQLHWLSKHLGQKKKDLSLYVLSFLQFTKKILLLKIVSSLIGRKFSRIDFFAISCWRSKERCESCLLQVLYILLEGENIIWQWLFIQNGAEQVCWNR